ncbi:MOSC domain-containing protein [Fodinicola acaciae]|uniref:MOSC domain-containing protein n=1 Tax=Fodinicola acaciae TaxID=2681555 RepID=UPI0013D3A013|nr:MOSC domain-containing protein [Fodinicola acaciae]
MPVLLSLNVGRRTAVTVKSGSSGIDKRPVDAVRVRAPGPKRGGLGSGLVGDTIVDVANHGGDDQAVYAYAREDLDAWQNELGEDLRNGFFGENLTTSGLDVTGALVGERWQVGDQVVLQVTAPRIPCATFAVWMRRTGWLGDFMRRGVPGAYLRVVTPGDIRLGDPISVIHRPDHDVTIGLVFRAVTLEPDLLPRLLEADDLLEEVRERATRRISGAN